MKKDIPLECAETRSADNQRGFALVIALSLMAFILLLLLSITTLVRVETQSSAISLARMEARQNALLGLQIAIGELQEHTGVDQVATGTSGLFDGVTASELPLANDTDAVLQKHWTGVWRRSSTDEQPEHLVWLVSGNEGLDPDAAGPDGVPQNVDPSFNNSSPLSSSNVWMVNRTVDPDQDGSNLDDKVQVPAVEFDEGLGRYAWWASDESVKANIALGDLTAGTLGTNDAELRVMTAQSLQPSAITGFSSMPSAAANLAVMIDAGDAQLVAPSVTDASMRDRFHDITTVSRGLLTNVATGGLKKDLTAALEGASSEFTKLTSAYGTQVFPAVDADGVTATTTLDNPGGPTWAQLQSFVTMRPESGNGNGLSATKTMETQTDDQMGVYPVMSSFQMYLTATKPGPQTVRLWLMPSVTFWNPYNVRIQVPVTYLRVTNNRSWQHQDFRFVAWLYPDATSTTLLSAVASSVGAPDYPLRFEIDSFTIEPGETLKFSPASSDVWSNPMDLSQGWNADNGYYLEGSAAAFVNATHFVVGVNDAYLGRQPMERINLDWTTEDLDAGQVAIPEAEVIQKVNGLFAQTAADGRTQFTPDSGSVHPPRYAFTSTNLLDQGKWGYDYRLTFTEYSSDFYPTGGTGSNYNVYSRIPWLKVGNPRANFHNISPVEISNESNTSPPSWAYNGGTVRLSKTFNDTMYDYELDFGSGIYSGQSGRRHTILFEIPQSNRPILSIGDLMHANLSNSEISSATDWGHAGGKSTSTVFSWMGTARYMSNDINPAYAIGNSMADPRIAPDKLAINWAGTNFFVTGDPSRNSSGTSGWHYDYSYLLNRALWDDFFFSAVPTSGVVPDILPNSMLETEPGTSDADLRDFDKAAANLLVSGALNVNTTSAESWKAVLAAFLGESVEIESGIGADPIASPILRLIKPKLDAIEPLTETEYDNKAYAGFRRLTSSEVVAYANSIVDEYIERRASIGPFLTLAAFVNRQLTGRPEHQQEGILQGAMAPLAGVGVPGEEVDGKWNINHLFRDPNLMVELPNDTSDDNSDADRGFEELIGGVNTQLPEPDHLGGELSFGAPGFLMQADVLARIGNLLTVRGDTFKVRAYGEASDPISGDVTRAWCEAVVQRQAAYVDDSADLPEVFPPTANVNQKFGRAYEIVSLRWLSEEEI